MKQLILSLSFFISLSVFALNITDAQGLRQGQWRKLYPNGQPMYEGTFKDDKPVGEMKRYYEDGKIRSIQQFIEGTDNFIIRNFDQNSGKLVSKGAFRGQLRDGEWQCFSGDVMIMSEQWQDGKLSGVTRIFNLNGTLIEEVNWLNDMMVGVRKRFFDDGKLFIAQEYNSVAALTGEVRMYFDNGVLAAKGTYREGKKDGNFEFFNPDRTDDFSFIARDGVMPPLRIDERQRQMLQDFEQQVEGVSAN